MNREFCLTAPAQWQQCAFQCLIQGNYNQAANLFEQAIAAEPNVKSHYWYLGLILLLQGQEVEAQTTWFLAMVGSESVQVEQWQAELVQVLQTEAIRREALTDNWVAWRIRYQIEEIYPIDINNLLHLVVLAIKLERYTGEELIALGVIKLLQLKPQIEVDFELLMRVLQSILNDVPLYPSALELVEACLAHIDTQSKAVTFINILVPASVKVAYSQRLPEAAARLGELGLRLDAKQPEVLRHLAGFYQTAGKYDKGIQIAKLYYSLREELPDLVDANGIILRGLMSAGGYWQEASSVFERQQRLLAALIEQHPLLNKTRVLRLFGSNFFAPYFQDNPINSRQIQNQLGQLCQANTEINAKEEIERYYQRHIQPQQIATSTKLLKIGYISYCLRSHSVGWLARWLFQYHNRERFQVNAYIVIGQDAYDPLQEWYVSQAKESYVSRNSWELAKKINEDEIDILIDLDSITLDVTCEVLALKPAPVQVTWLGWDASSIPTVDYFIADPYVLPESAQEYYTEKIWRLPHTYIAVDGFEVGVPTLRREDLEIETNAVVYLCTQKGYKRHPDTARLQMKLIKAVPNSYFLIKGLADEESIKSFFIQLAEEEGVDTNRLRFLPDVPSEAVHRANLGIADIVLDTYPYNGATTTLETLWMCIPLVTRVGQQFAARNSYTMMMNAGVKEGIAWTDEEYIQWGIRLGKDEALRQQVAWKLKASRQTSPLWNAKQFTHNMEKAYEQMWQRYIEAKH